MEIKLADSTKYNFRFFNASNGQMYGAISEKGNETDRGWLKIFHEDASPKNSMSYYTRSTQVLQRKYILIIW